MKDSYLSGFRHFTSCVLTSPLTLEEMELLGETVYLEIWKAQALISLREGSPFLANVPVYAHQREHFVIETLVGVLQYFWGQNNGNNPNLFHGEVA